MGSPSLSGLDLPVPDFSTVPRRPLPRIFLAIAGALLLAVLGLAVYFGSIWLTFGPDAPATDHVAEYNRLAMNAAGISSPEKNTWALVDAIALDIERTAEQFGSEWQDDPLYIVYSMLYTSDSTPEDRAAARIGMAELERRGMWDKLDQLAESPGAARLLQANANMFEELAFSSQAIRQASSAITARMLDAMESRDYASAVRSLRHGLTLARIVARQPTLIDRLVGLHMESRISSALRTRVLADRPDAETLRQFIALLADHTPPRMSATLEGDCLVGEQTLYNMFGTSVIKPFNRGAQIARLREIYEAAAAYAEKPRGLRDPAVADQLRELMKLGRPYFALEILIPAFGMALRSDDISIANHHGTMLLLAIELFIAQHGRPPDALADLVASGTLQTIPGDPFGAGGFVYRRLGSPVGSNGAGYILYSVGFDGTNDGGRLAEGHEAAFHPQGHGTDFVYSLPDQ